MQEKRNTPNSKLIPLAIILACLAVLSRFFTDPFRYTIQADDMIFLQLLKSHSILDSSFAVQETFNGRWFSHLYTCIVFSILKTNWTMYFLYDLFAFLLLVLSLFCFFHAFIKRKFISQLSFAKKILLSFFTATVFFIFLVDGRYEVFYWVSSVSNHLLSVILFFFALALFAGSFNYLRLFLLALIAFCLGQMNEIYIINYLLVLFILQLVMPQSRIYFIAMVIVLGISFFYNITATGTASRFNRAVPEFSITQTMKDIAETFLLPITNYRYLPMKIAALVLLVLSVQNYFKLSFTMPGNYFILFNRLLLLACLLGVLAQCFLLRMVCPYRSLLVYCLALIYFLFVMAGKKIINPLKLFF